MDRDGGWPRGDRCAGVARGILASWKNTVDAAPVVATTSCGGGRGPRHPRRLSRHLLAAASDAAVLAAIQHEIDGYFRLHGNLACAEGLPRVGVELRRLVVVPCALLNGAAYHTILRRLNSEPVFATLEGGDGLRDVFVLRLIHEIEKAVVAALPSPKHPLAAGDEWITVGLNRVFVWRSPLLQGPSWTGHHYVLELRRQPITRAIR